MAVYRSDQFAIGITVEGLPEGKTTDNVAWDEFDGGENTVSLEPYLPGGMKPQVQVGGIPKRAPAKVKRAWSDSLLPIFKALDSVAGQAVIKATVTTLNTKKEPVPGAAPISYTGVLGTVTRPKYGASTSEMAYLELELGLDGELA